MGQVELSGWPVVHVGAELLRHDSAHLLRWVSAHRDSYSLLIDARGGVTPPRLCLSGEFDIALARCVRLAVCVGSHAALGIIWHHRLRSFGDVERRLFVDFQRGLHWAREPHGQRLMRGSWISIAPAMRPSAF